MNQRIIRPRQVVFLILALAIGTSTLFYAILGALGAPAWRFGGEHILAVVGGTILADRLLHRWRTGFWF